MRFRVERFPRGSRTEKLHLIHPQEGSIGSLQYVRHPDHLQIEMMRVKREHRGNGYAGQLMDELQRRNPATPIDHGERTDDGNDWWDAYSSGKDVQNGRTMASLYVAEKHPTRDSVPRITHEYSFADGDSWPEVRDNFVMDHPSMRRMRDDIRQNGIQKPIAIDYEQTPPRVLDGHTRLAHAEALGMSHVPVRHVTQFEHALENADPEDSHYEPPRERFQPPHESMVRNGATELGHDLGDFHPHPKSDRMRVAQCKNCGAEGIYSETGQMGGRAIQEPCAIHHTAAIRMVSPEEYRTFRYPDYPKAKTPDALVRHFKRTSPDYYNKIKEDVQQNGFTTPVLVRYHGPGGRPLPRPEVMEGHHRAAVAHELGVHLPVGDYDHQDDYDTAFKAGQQWFRDNQRPTGDMPHQATQQRVSVPFDYHREAPETWGQDYHAYARQSPHAAAVGQAQEHMRLHEPIFSQQIPDEPSATRTIQHLLSKAGHPSAEDAWVSYHPHPEKGTSNTFHTQYGEVGAVLHPDRFDYGTLAHETAHLTHQHELGVQSGQGLSDEELHGRGFMAHYRRHADVLRPGAGGELHGAYEDALERIRGQQHTARAAYREFEQLAPHEQAAVTQYYPQMIEEHGAAPDSTPYDYRYEVRQEPLQQFIKRYMDADDEFKAEYPHGAADFIAHHEEMLHNHPIPHYPAKNRWPLIVNDANPNYVDDGYHRMHSYIRDGATSIPTIRIHAKDGVPKYARAVLPHERLFGPTYGLDHRLFEDDKLRPEVRTAIIQKWADFCDRHDFPMWHAWAKIVFFGSEASTWTSPTLEGNNDFDLSIGIEYDRFRAHVEMWSDLGDEEIATRMTDLMHEELNDPNTHYHLANGTVIGPFEQTWFANLLGWDIRQIRPYAAYDVARAQWIVRPLNLSHWDITQFPEGHGLTRETQGIIEMARGVLAMPEPYRTQNGDALWHFVHDNRSRAFGPQGEGWWDVRNVVEKALDQKGLMQGLYACHDRADHTPGSLDAPAGWSNDPDAVR